MLPWILEYWNVRNIHVGVDKMAKKTDMERVGLFSEQGYTTITDPYVPPTGSEYIIDFRYIYIKPM